MPPTLAGFIAFVQQVMGITTNQLPSDSPVIAIAFNVAMSLVNLALQAVPSNPSSPSIYALAVYNLAGDNLVNYAQDPPEAPVYKNDLPFFAYLRKSMNIDGFVGGVIQSSADETTSEAMVVPEAFKLFTMANLQTLKTPWGRAYMSFAMDYGYLVGVS